MFHQYADKQLCARYALPWNNLEGVVSNFLRSLSRADRETTNEPVSSHSPGNEPHILHQIRDQICW